jgi:hypothetical protein
MVLLPLREKVPGRADEGFKIVEKQFKIKA